jgi:hypothetical protein
MRLFYSGEFLIANMNEFCFIHYDYDSTWTLIIKVTLLYLPQGEVPQGHESLRIFIPTSVKIIIYVKWYKIQKSDQGGTGTQMASYPMDI